MSDLSRERIEEIARSARALAGMGLSMMALRIDDVLALCRMAGEGDEAASGRGQEVNARGRWVSLDTPAQAATPSLPSTPNAPDHDPTCTEANPCRSCYESQAMDFPTYHDRHPAPSTPSAEAMEAARAFVNDPMRWENTNAARTIDELNEREAASLAALLESWGRTHREAIQREREGDREAMAATRDALEAWSRDKRVHDVGWEWELIDNLNARIAAIRAPSAPDRREGATETASGVSVREAQDAAPDAGTGSTSRAPSLPSTPSAEAMPARDELVEALRLHRAEIVEADEWRPLADHVAALLESWGREQREELRAAVALVDRRVVAGIAFGAIEPRDAKITLMHLAGVVERVCRLVDGTDLVDTIPFIVRARVAAKPEETTHG